MNLDRWTWPNAWLLPLPMALVASLAACGGGGSGESAPPPPRAGRYAVAQFAEAQISPHIDVVYSVRPNAGRLQYTSDANKAREVGQPTLSLQMDIFVPPNATPTAPQPLVVFVHGGGFVQGGKEANRSKALSYAQAGYVAASVNYRLTPDNSASQALRVLAQTQAAEDLGNAVRFLRQNAAVYRIDASRVATIGGSAGGALSLMNAVDADTLPGAVSDFPGVSAQAQGAVSTGATLIDIYDTVGLLSFDADDVPVLLLHADPTDSSTGATWTGNVLPTQALIQNAGNSCTLVAQPNLTHGADLSVSGPYWGAVYPFLYSRLGLAALGAPAP